VRLSNHPTVTPSDQTRALSHGTVYIDHKWLAQQGGLWYEPILAELEERVGFTERILAEGNRPDELRASSS